SGRLHTGRDHHVDGRAPSRRVHPTRTTVHRTVGPAAARHRLPRTVLRNRQILARSSTRTHQHPHPHQNTIHTHTRTPTTVLPTEMAPQPAHTQNPNPTPTTHTTPVLGTTPASPPPTPPLHGRDTTPMPGLPEVPIVGPPPADPELRYTPTGAAV